MNITEIFELVPVGGAFYREAKPEVLYERIGVLIERNGLGWARLEASDRGDWTILPDGRSEEDIQATDWTLQKSSQNERTSSARKPRLRPLISEKTRLAWTLYDQIDPPKQ